ncbi:MAG: HepT-like ribonuclease domain-containing protein [Thermodesulfobacteriota bacterium]
MDKLLEEISIESEYIKETLKLITEALNRPNKTAIELSAIASFIHHSYSGMENIIKRILKYNKVDIPDSDSSHKDLLNIAVEKKIISQELSDKLDRYRGFRHFFIHAYGVFIDKEKLKPLTKDLPDIWKQFEKEIQKFVNI